jgi:SAM-dependent methyltransferase
MSKFKSTDYHDYFIKDGRFIGEFEAMYQNVDDPWHIEALGRRPDMDAALMLLGRSGESFERILDVGCGKGFFSNLLLEATNGRIYAFDISETAVRQARQDYPSERIEFFTHDLHRIENLPHAKNSFDLVVMAQTVWCVLPGLNDIFRCFREFLKPGGSLLVSQHFLQPGQQKYGVEILSTPADLIRMIEAAGFEVKATIETNRFTNHHLALWAKPSVGTSSE